MSDPAENSESTATVRKSRRIMKQNADDLADEKSPTLSKQIKKSKPTEKAEPMDMSEQSETPDPIKSCEPLEKSEVQVTESYEEVDKTEIIDMSEQIKTPDPTNSSETLDKSESIETSTPMDTSGPIEKSEPLEPINIVESAAFTDIEKPEQLKTAIKSPTLDKQIEKSELLKSESIENVELIKNSEEIENREPLVKSDLIDKSEKVETPDLLERVEQTENIELLNQPEPIENIELLNQSEPIENIELSNQPESMKSDPIEKADLIEKSEPVENSAVKVESELLKTDKDIEIKVKPDLTDVSRQIRKQKDKNLCFSCGKTGHKKLDCPLRNQKTENEQTVSESDPSGNKNKENLKNQPSGEINEQNRKRKRTRRERKKLQKLKALEALESKTETVKLAAAGEKTEGSSSATNTNGTQPSTTTNNSEVTMNISPEIKNIRSLKKSKPADVASTVPLHVPLSVISVAAKKDTVKCPAATKRNNSSELNTAAKRQQMTKKPETARPASLKSNTTSSAGGLKNQATKVILETVKLAAAGGKTEGSSTANNMKGPQETTTTKSSEVTMNVSPEIVNTHSLKVTKPTVPHHDPLSVLSIASSNAVTKCPAVTKRNNSPELDADTKRQRLMTKEPETAKSASLKSNATSASASGLKNSTTAPQSNKTVTTETENNSSKAGSKITVQIGRERNSEPQISWRNLNITGNQLKQIEVQLNRRKNVVSESFKKEEYIHYFPLEPKMLFITFDPFKASITHMSKGRKNPPDSYVYYLDFSVTYESTGCLLCSHKQKLEANTKCTIQFFSGDAGSKTYFKLIGTKQAIQKMRKAIQKCIEMNHSNSTTQLMDVIVPGRPGHRAIEINVSGNIATRMMARNGSVVDGISKKAHVSIVFYPEGVQDKLLERILQIIGPPPGCIKAQKMVKTFIQRMVNEGLEPSFLPNQPKQHPLFEQISQEPSMMQPNQPFAQQRFQQPPSHPFAQQSFQQPTPEMFNYVNQMTPQHHQTPQNFTINTKDISPALGHHSRAGFKGHQDSRHSFERPFNNSLFGQPVNNTPFRQPFNNAPFGHQGNHSSFGQLDKKAAFGHSDIMHKFIDMPMYNAHALKNPDNLALARFLETSEIQNVTPKVADRVFEPKDSEDIASQLLEYCVSLLSDIKNKPKPRPISPAPIDSMQVDPILQQLSSLISLSTPQSSMDELPLEEPKNQQPLVIDYQHSSAPPDPLNHQRSWPRPDEFEYPRSSEQPDPHDYQHLREQLFRRYSTFPTEY